jgi:hypothetical protein
MKTFFRPMKSPKHIVSAVLLLFTTCRAASVSHSARSLRFEAPAFEPNVVKSLSFNQQLLVCNAYPGNDPMSMKQNGQESLPDQRSIRFQECRRMSGQVRSKDKLDFMFANSGMQGSFEIGKLPDADALLLLVVEKRDSASSLVSFQSFAFPSSSDGPNAQLAVIDTYKGTSSSPHLRMEDHINNKERKTISKRVEQLSFNRIYAIEEGTYDMSISDHILDGDEHGAEGTKSTFHLAKKQNYVVLRTGGGQLSQSLVVYPPDLTRSASHRTSASFAAAVFVLIMALVF